MHTLMFIIPLIIDTYAMFLLLRIWMQWSRADFYNPLSQFVVKVTQPVVGPLRRILPPLGPIDSASLLLAFILLALKYPLLLLIQHGSFVLSPQLLYVAALLMVKAVGRLLFWIIIAQALMSWISQGRSPMEQLMHQLTEPFMRPIRRVLPSFGNIDFSPMIVILALSLLNKLGFDLFGSLWLIQ